MVLLKKQFSFVRSETNQYSNYNPHRRRADPFQIQAVQGKQEQHASQRRYADLIQCHCYARNSGQNDGTDVNQPPPLPVREKKREENQYDSRRVDCI